MRTKHWKGARLADQDYRIVCDDETKTVTFETQMSRVFSFNYREFMKLFELMKPAYEFCKVFMTPKEFKQWDDSHD